MQLDLLLTPLAMELRAECKLFIPFIGKQLKILDLVIWRFKAPTISKNIFTIIKEDKDTSPPVISSDIYRRRKRRDTSSGCLVEQIKERDHLNPAYSLSVDMSDDTSQLDIAYAIGTQSGGTNVVDWTVMGGQNVLMPTTDLPNGIPLFWTVRARNSQGISVFGFCYLETYDTTPPDGRIDHSYRYSSHPHTVSAIVHVFDDSVLVSSHRKAFGLSSGRYGNEEIDWDTFHLEQSTVRNDKNSDMKHFRDLIEGKLSTSPFEQSTQDNLLLCAAECLKFSVKCVSFDYEYHTESCELQEFTVGHLAQIRISGAFEHYERLGVGHTTDLRYTNIKLRHGAVYFINVNITNMLGYEKFLHSTGTIVDYTTPDTAYLGTNYVSELRKDGCTAALTQRCIDATWLENHR